MSSKDGEELPEAKLFQGAVKQDLRDVRKPYRPPHETFLESDIEVKDPFHLFNVWFTKAQKEADTYEEANGMTIATASKDGRPSCRVVLLKGYDTNGFTFFTNYDSQKGRELTENPYAAIVFYYARSNRQIRVEGTVSKVEASVSDEYWVRRPPGSQASAACSEQSTPIPDKQPLIDAMGKLQKEFIDAEKPIPRPCNWGGFVLKPERFEFWQGQSNRLHDRILFIRDGQVSDVAHQGENGWIYERLNP